MTKRVFVSEHGGAERLQFQEIAVSAPQPNEVQLQHAAIGVNYIDVYYRQGLYKPEKLPFTPGLEAAGVITAVGEHVTDLQVGDRVAYASPPLGAYAEARNMLADRVVKLPSFIDERTAAAIMTKGLTAEYLLRRTYPVQAGDLILIHAAAGGVGLMACQWAKHLGATVIGTVGTEAKAELAHAHGCDYPLLYTRENWVERVRTLTQGQGVRVVYDSVGKDTFMSSLDCLCPRGLMVSFGQASGAVPPLEIGILNAKGSLFLTRPSLMGYTAKRADLLTAAQALFDVIQKGVVKIHIHASYPLSQAAQAHRDLESRKTTGSLILVP